MVGFRNILVHEYGKIDKGMVFDYLENNLNDIVDFKKVIVKYLRKK